MTIAVVVGAYMDYNDFMSADYDTSSYEAQELIVTQTGLLQRGRVLDNLLDCTDGMIHVELYKFNIPFRKVSSTGIAVEAPRAACVDRGFVPSF